MIIKNQVVETIVIGNLLVKSAVKCVFNRLIPYKLAKKIKKKPGNCLFPFCSSMKLFYYHTKRKYSEFPTYPKKRKESTPKFYLIVANTTQGHAVYP